MNLKHTVTYVVTAFTLITATQSYAGEGFMARFKKATIAHFFTTQKQLISKQKPVKNTIKKSAPTPAHKKQQQVRLSQQPKASLSTRTHKSASGKSIPAQPTRITKSLLQKKAAMATANTVKTPIAPKKSAPQQQHKTVAQSRVAIKQLPAKKTARPTQQVHTPKIVQTLQQIAQLDQKSLQAIAYHTNPTATYSLVKSLDPVAKKLLSADQYKTLKASGISIMTQKNSKLRAAQFFIHIAKTILKEQCSLSKLNACEIATAQKALDSLLSKGDCNKPNCPHLFVK